MKRGILWAAAVLGAYLAYVAISVALLPPVAELKNRKLSRTIQVRDWSGEYHPFVLGPKNRTWTSIGNIPAEMKWAVVLAEDANFYRHEGIDVKAIKNAIKYDLEKQSLAKGASTITQQTAKNIFLSREKTITRKLKELYLAVRMEQELTKGRIIELYLNVVELGPMVYGIGQGSRYYFGKSPAELTPRECAFLAAMLPGPRVAYNPYRNLDKVLRRSEMILKLLKGKGVLSADEYRMALAEIPNIGRMQVKVETSIQQPVPVFTPTTSANSSTMVPIAPTAESVPAPSTGTGGAGLPGTGEEPERPSTPPPAGGQNN
jgi:monofunctional biosynthetic peptidoglycan transglycosylase